MGHFGEGIICRGFIYEGRYMWGVLCIKAIICGGIVHEATAKSDT